MKFISLGVVVALMALVLVVGAPPHHPQDHSPYSTLNGTSNLLADGGVDDSVLRACDTWANGAGYTAWSHDKQSGNWAFATDNTGANDGNCTNKQLNRNHDQHGSGNNIVDARADIQNNAYSAH